MDDLSLQITNILLVFGAILIGLLILKSIYSLYRAIWVEMYKPELKTGYLLHLKNGEIYCFLSKTSLMNHFDLNREGYGEDIVDRLVFTLEDNNLEYVNTVLNDLFDEAVQEVFIVKDVIHLSNKR